MLLEPHQVALFGHRLFNAVVCCLHVRCSQFVLQHSLCICTCVSVCIRVYVRMYVCVRVRGVTCKEMVARHLTCTYVHMLVSARQLMHIHMYIYVRMYVCTCVRTSYSAYLCMHTKLHTSQHIQSSVRYVVVCTYDAST